MTVMTWEGFSANYQKVRFANLHTAKRFISYLLWEYKNTRQRKNMKYYDVTCKSVAGCPFHIILRAEGGNDRYRSYDNLQYTVRKCIGHNHDKNGKLLQSEKKSDEFADNAELTSNSPANDEENPYAHNDDTRLE